MYNPMTQQRRHDPDGEYVRRWLPELRGVPDAKLAEPWTMSEDEQRAAGCVIGEDYPAPVVDHKAGARAGDGALRRGARGPLRSAPAVAQLYLQRDQPPGVPPLQLTGERTLPDVPEENYWYRRHLVVYQWIASRVGGRRVVDLACGEGYGSAVLARTAASVVGVDANPEAFEHARLKYSGPKLTLRAQHDRAVGGRRRLRRVPPDDRARPGPRRGARAAARR